MFQSRRGDDWSVGNMDSEEGTLLSNIQSPGDQICFDISANNEPQQKAGASSGEILLP